MVWRHAIWFGNINSMEICFDDEFSKHCETVKNNLYFRIRLFTFFYNLINKSYNVEKIGCDSWRSSQCSEMYAYYISNCNIFFLYGYGIYQVMQNKC